MPWTEECLLNVLDIVVGEQQGQKPKPKLAQSEKPGSSLISEHSPQNRQNAFSQQLCTTDERNGS